ncbi:MAG TPA: acyltransferase family protein [Candidatus Acidoferrum sp.]|nr:acyltransferase family protein [Candidatus Acidoferrum sp.]
MAEPPSKANRNPALDFTKGALVLIMVLYHWMNYFYGPHDNRYLRFLTPSFICITGFLISNIYLSKYKISDPRLPKRLLERGAKILGVFFVLNIMRILLVQGAFTQHSGSEPSPASNLIDVYLIGSGVGGGQSKAVAFFVLIPIGYVLILSAVLAILSRFYRYAFHVVCLIALLTIVILAANDLQSPNLELVTIGLLGVLAGYLPTAKVDAIVRHSYILAGAYVLYLLAITFWNIIYPLQIIGVFLSLMILYRLGQVGDQPGFGARIVILLGKYSLFGYIAQIAVLQILHFGLIRLGSRTVVQGISFVLAFALTILSVVIVDRARAKSAIANKAYGAVFA